MIPELPLLRRELAELSSRRRTYVIRFVGAIIVLTTVMVYYNFHMALLGSSISGFGSANPHRFLGAGAPIFRGLVPVLFVSVQLLMPALICGSITIEKERNTIGTLFVTRLSPMTIVLEKLGSRLVPMFTFLLLTFPVLAVVYSLGGVETTFLLGTLWLLFCECLLHASIGLLCSSWFATTVTAFIWSYGLTGLLAVFSSLFAHDLPLALPTPYYLWIAAFQGFNSSGYGNNSLLSQSSSGFLHPLAQMLFVVATTIPSLMVTAVMVLMARVFLVRRAFISSASVMLKVFKSIDGFFVRLNDRTTGGMVLMKDYTSLPLFDPVAWRERSKKSLGKARYLFRILVVMEGPTLFICVGAATVSARSDFSGLRDLLLLVWGIVAMILAMKGATIISTERVRETLDALLSTPLTAKEILTQKVAGMQRLMMVLAIPILSVHFTLLLLNVDFREIMSSPATILIVVWYTLGFILTTFLTMQILVWLAVLFGLRSQSQSRSAMTGICLIAGWVIVSSFLGRPGGYVFEAFSNICQSIQQGDSSRSGSENNETPTMQLNQTIAAVICCMIRADGGIQANEGVLVAVGNPYVEKTELYYAPSRSIHAALTVATVVFLWQVLLLSLIRMLTLRLAPRMLGRFDQESEYHTPEVQHLTSPSGTISEMIA